MGLFANNHDNERFLHVNYNIPRFKGALTFTLLFRGIPIIYYGDEQGFKGANDPWCREALWPHMNTNSELYLYLKKIITFRRIHAIWKQPFIFIYQDDHLYVFARGDVLCIFSNSDNTSQTKTFEKIPYPEGTKLCNILKDECVTVSQNRITVFVDISETKLFERRS